MSGRLITLESVVIDTSSKLAKMVDAKERAKRVLEVVISSVKAL